jgi:hypothetical protein
MTLILIAAFQLRALHLPGCHFTTWTTLPAPFLLYFLGSVVLPRSSLTMIFLISTSLSSWNYRCVIPHLTLWWLILNALKVFFFFFSTGVWMWDFAVVEKVLYHLSHTPKPFCVLVTFWVGSHVGLRPRSSYLLFQYSEGYRYAPPFLT